MQRVKSLVAQSLESNQIQSQFNESLRSIWKRTGGQSVVGIAVSGGVDSMALASLCLTAKEQDPSLPVFKAFIVDHRLRKESADEAEAASVAMSRMGVQTQILKVKVKWKSISPQRVEGVARTLRFQALGQACAGSRIGALLLGHHADDQAETIIQRLAMKYYGNGLKGIKDVAKIPQCNGMYGVDESGGKCFVACAKEAPLVKRPTRQMAIEDGGVMLGRPLLSFTKDQLVRLCQDRAVEWSDDPTNSDPRYALRNTIRSMEARGELPAALGRERLIALAQSRLAATQTTDVQVEEMLQRTDLNLNMRSGRLTMRLRRSPTDGTPQATLAVQAGFVKEVCAVLDPASGLDPGGSIHAAVNMLFHADKSEKVVALGKLRLQKISPSAFALERTPPSDKDPIKRSEPFTMKQRILGKNAVWAQWLVANRRVRRRERRKFKRIWTSDWLLWDERYWIRVLHLSGEEPIKQYAVRSLTERDVKILRIRYPRVPTTTLRTLKDEPREAAMAGKALDLGLKVAPGDLQFTLPVITQSENGLEEIVAIPTLGWSIKNVGNTLQGIHIRDTVGTLRYEIRHRKIGIRESSGIQFAWKIDKG